MMQRVQISIGTLDLSYVAGKYGASMRYVGGSWLHMISGWLRMQLTTGGVAAFCEQWMLGRQCHE